MANDFNTENLVNIKVVGVGGGGGNAVNRMIELDSDGKGVEYINVNTDAHILVKSAAPNKISIGDKITKGRGAGADPSLGEKAAEESADAITEALTGANMVFITAGMGGGTGTGAAPVVARIAKSMGILTVAVVTKPFAFEGPKRMRQAEEGIRKLSEYVDSLVVIPNERLKLLTDKKITFLNAFHEADDILCKGVQSICDLITQSGYINLGRRADLLRRVKRSRERDLRVGVYLGQRKEIPASAERARLGHGGAGYGFEAVLRG